MSAQGCFHRNANIHQLPLKATLSLSSLFFQIFYDSGWISQHRDVSLDHAVPYEEIHCLLFSQSFFESTGNNDRQTSGSLRRGPVSFSYRGQGEKQGLSLVGFNQMGLTSGLSERRGAFTGDRWCSISLHWQLRPNSSNPEGGNWNFCLSGRIMTPSTLQLVFPYFNSKSVWSPGFNTT